MSMARAVRTVAVLCCGLSEHAERLTSNDDTTSWQVCLKCTLIFIFSFTGAKKLTFLLFTWSQSRKVRSDTAHPVISTPHRLRTSEILMPKSVSSAVTHCCHHRPALPFWDWHPFTKPVLILAEEISSTFVPCGYAVLYTISRSGT